jgi:predicted nucleotidyltransferase
MDVIKILEKNKKKIEKKYSVEKIGIFGSYVKGIQKESSDIDILVEFKNPTYDNFINLAFYLEELYGKRINLVTVKGLSPYIYPFVKKEIIWC